MEQGVKNSSKNSFEDCVASQIDLLNDGKPLAAFDAFFDPAGLMFANDTLFATGHEEGRRKQEPYISPAVSITGLVTDLKILAAQRICVFRNKSSFATADGEVHQIDGLCWQKWQEGQIVEERYFDGTRMEKLIADGILDDPTLLLRRK